MNELPVPPPAETSSDANEIARIWAVDGSMFVTLSHGAWDDPAAWGLMLVDIARHAANSYEHHDGIPAADALARIREGFDAEWSSPTG